MVAIETRYVPPTNHRGSRIMVGRMDRKPTDKAQYGDSGKMMVSQPCELDHIEAHDYAAKFFCTKMGWSGILHRGGTLTGFVYVFESRTGIDKIVISESEVNR